MATINLPDGVYAAAVICVGDTDKDGKVGLKPLLYGDVPDWIDGKPGLSEVPFFNDLVPEVDEVPLKEMGKTLNGINKQLGPALAFVTGFVKRKRRR